MSDGRRLVLVVGSGTAAAMAATAIARSLPDIRVVRLDDGEEDALDELLGASRPSVRAFHGALGVDEAEVVERTRASYRLGTRVSGWSDIPYFRGHGMYGESVSGVSFHHLWLRAHSRGTVAPFDSFSISASLASQSRFAAPSSQRESPLAGLDYGLQLNLPAYAQALRSLGRAAGVEEIHGNIAAILQSSDGGCIRALKLADGRELAADLYIDASGHAAGVRRALPWRWIDWSASLPVDRLLFSRPAANQIPPVSDDLVALAAGWRYEARLQDATVHLLAYSSAHETDDQARATFHHAAGTAPRDQPVVLRQGRLEDPWAGNCVAIGSAAVSLEPSAASSLHAVCRHLDRLIACWPGHDSRATPAEIAYFNRRTALGSDRLRDFVQLPYLLNQRPEALWRAAAAGPVSAELARDLALFRERGRLSIHDEDGFERDEWLASLIGLGVIPRRIDPVAAELPMSKIQQRLEAISTGLRQLMETLQ